MDCWYCKEPMDEQHGKLSITYLDKNVSIRFKQCDYFYCEKCDIVRFSKEDEKRIKDVLKEHDETSKFKFISL